jgi:YHS domain-containing protein
MVVVYFMSEIDPVCGMRVDPTRAKYKSVYRGRVYYFCSRHCMEEFEKNPEYYLKSGPRGSHPGDHSY